jgi:transcriptional regulator with XRE-family HTH domain
MRTTRRKTKRSAGDCAPFPHSANIFLGQYLEELNYSGKTVYKTPPDVAGEGEMSKEATSTDQMVGQRVRVRRKELGFSQQKLGDAIGVTFQQIQKYENGVNRIGAGRLSEISKVLQVKIDYFFSGVAEPDADLTLAPLRQQGALELLQTYARIDSPMLRKAVVELARTLASREAPRKRAATA